MEVICLDCETVFAVPDLEDLFCPECGSDDLQEAEPTDEPWDGFRSDAEADADVLRSAGFGTDEDYGYYGGDE